MLVSSSLLIGCDVAHFFERVLWANAISDMIDSVLQIELDRVTVLTLHPSLWLRLEIILIIFSEVAKSDEKSEVDGRLLFTLLFGSTPMALLHSVDGFFETNILCPFDDVECFNDAVLSNRALR